MMTTPIEIPLPAVGDLLICRTAKDKPVFRWKVITVDLAGKRIEVSHPKLGVTDLKAYILTALVRKGTVKIQKKNG